MTIFYKYYCGTFPSQPQYFILHNSRGTHNKNTNNIAVQCAVSAVPKSPHTVCRNGRAKDQHHKLNCQAELHFAAYCSQTVQTQSTAATFHITRSEAISISSPFCSPVCYFNVGITASPAFCTCMFRWPVMLD